MLYYVLKCFKCLVLFQAENRQREAVTEAQAEVAMLRKQIKDLNLKVSEVDSLTKRIKEKEVKKLKLPSEYQTSPVFKLYICFWFSNGQIIKSWSAYHTDKRPVYDQHVWNLNGQPILLA